jgi:hypothetical protein
MDYMLTFGKGRKEVSAIPGTDNVDFHVVTLIKTAGIRDIADVLSASRRFKKKSTAS